jgi:FixJ family two-component response regulator
MAIPQIKGVVFVVDNDAAVRQSMDLLLRSAGWVVQLCETAERFLSRPTGDTPSCLILDINLPGLSNPDVQRRLAAYGQKMPTIFITGENDIPLIVRSIKAGPIAFLTKPLVDTDVLEAVERAMEGSRLAHAKAAEERRLRALYDTLTPRERQVMGLVVSGLLNKQVGGELGTSEITVKAHRGQVMRKMKVDSLADLVRTASTLQVPLIGKQSRMSA